MQHKQYSQLRLYCGQPRDHELGAAVYMEGGSGYQVEKEKKNNCRPISAERPAATMFVLFVPSTWIVPTIVTAHTFCASRDTRVSYGWCLLTQEYFCAV